jgi:rRNA-processing protein FCF1
MTSIWEAAQALREAAVIRVSILRAFKPGDVIVLETDRTYSRDQLITTRQRLKELIDDTGVKVILLDAGMRVVARDEEAIGGPGT